MRKIDLHIHTHHSDATITVAEVAKHARRENIAAGICDHLSPYHNLYGPDPFDIYVADVRQYKHLWLGAECCFGVEPPVGRDRLAELDYLMGAVHSITSGGVNYFLWGELVPEDLDTYMDDYLKVACEGISALRPDILAHPTFLPPALQDRHEELWTRARIERLWEACARAGVAVEISGRWLVPKPDAVKLALEMGLVFSLGSDAHRLERLFNIDYSRAMVDTYGIPDERIFVPRRIGG